MIGIMKSKIKIKVIVALLIMLFAVPVFAAGEVSVESISGSSKDNEVIFNANDQVDIQFNDLEQSAEYEFTLKNNTNKAVYVRDIVVENLSEEFIDFSIDDEFVDKQIESGATEKINVLVETLDISHAGRNVNDQITLKILYGNAVVNPNTNSDIIELIALIVLFVGLVFFIKRSKLKKISVFVIVGLLFGVTTVYANDNYVSVDGVVKFVSQNLLQSSGVTLNGHTLNYSNASKIWNDASKVKKIIISDKLNELEDFEEKFDLTLNSSERVVAYFVNNGDSNVPYDLYIQAKGVIYAPVDSTGLFTFPNVEEIEGLEYIEFDETTNMTAMFKGDEKLKKLDLSSIDMSNVLNTSYMFNGCKELSVSEDDFKLNDSVVKDYMLPVKIVANGSLDEIGTIVTIGSENFYTIGSEGENVKLFAMYNLHVGNSLDSNWNVTLLSNPTGMQSSDAKGAAWDGDGGPRIFPSIGTVAFSNDSQKGTKYNDYSGSIVEVHVNNYKNELEKLGVEINGARLISKDELTDSNTFGCVIYGSCSSKYSWINSTSYWTGTGDAENENYVWRIYGGGGFSNNENHIDFDFGVRPVIVISKDYFN